MRFELWPVARSQRWIRAAAQPVTTDEQRVATPAVAQLGKYSVPEFGALGLLDPDTQDLLDAVDVNADHHVGGLVGHHAAVADLDADGIDRQDRIRRGGFQSSLRISEVRTAAPIVAEVRSGCCR